MGIHIKLLSRKVSSVQFSPTLKIGVELKAAKARGVDAVDFSVGEPIFDLFEPIQQAGIRAIQQSKARYTPIAGIAELRRAIAEKLLKENHINCDESMIIVSNGAKQALFNAICALANPGDEFIIVRPYWGSYEDMIKLADAIPVVAESVNFAIHASEIEKQITPKTKAILINYPCNPSGATIARDELEHIARVATEHDLFVISDEIYEQLTYEGTHVSIASLPGMDKRTITINGFSKTYAMTGLRVGYSCAPSEITRLIENMQSQTTSGASSIAQFMALGAFSVPLEDVQAIIKNFKCKRDLMVQLLREAGFTVTSPPGAFYVFVRVSDDAFAEQLMKREQVAVVPGSAFGMPGFIRMSYATSEEQIREGIARIRRCM